MSFNPANLVRLDLEPGCSTWKYDAGSDNRSDVEGANYFVPNYMLDVGDVVFVTANDGKAVYKSSGVSIVKMANVSTFESPYST